MAAPAPRATDAAGTSRGPMETAWVSNFTPLAQGVAPATVPYERIGVMVDLKAYSLRNGTPDEIEPYLLTAAIAAKYHWVPINGAAPQDALRCVDGYIRSYLYKLSPTGNAATPEANTKARKEAIALGICRAVMSANFELLPADINPQELAPPVLSVTFSETGVPAYTALVAAASENAALLTANLNLTVDELEVVKVLARSAQAIIPVQGLNLITEGHHYLSDKAKQSYKAFLAVERQVWMSESFKTWIATDEKDLRDIIWHKAGHPVAVSLKEAAATSLEVKANLEAAKMGSAAARLPALESDLRAADTYLKLAQAIDAVWSTMGGRVDYESIRFRVAMIRKLPRTTEEFAAPMTMGEGVEVTSRAAAVNVLKSTVMKNSAKAAVLYGFYCTMLEMGATDMTAAATDTLRTAHSLKKLKANDLASYTLGSELYRDYRAMRAAARRSGERKMPEMVLEG
uniref:Uncharacterized protein n=1 Tax=Noccaea caerulescens TaxID=107243 RepID=A0A1J3FQY6_NOCCA